MLCQQCLQQTAVVHITQIIGQQVIKRDLCEPCSRSVGLPPQPALGAGWTSYSPETRVIIDTSSLAGILNRPLLFHEEAYQIVLESLFAAASVTHLQRQSQQPEQVSATQLLEAFRQIALNRFGKEARAVLRGWGIERTEDVGKIVFDMVEAGFWQDSEGNKPEDFANGYDFSEAFPKE